MKEYQANKFVLNSLYLIIINKVQVSLVIHGGKLRSFKNIGPKIPKQAIYHQNLCEESNRWITSN